MRSILHDEKTIPNFVTTILKKKVTMCLFFIEYKILIYIQY